MSLSFLKTEMSCSQNTESATQIQKFLLGTTSLSISPSINFTTVQTSTVDILHLQIVADLITSKTGTIILKEAANTCAAKCGRETANFAQGHMRIQGLVSSDVTFLLN